MKLTWFHPENPRYVVTLSTKRGPWISRPSKMHYMPRVWAEPDIPVWVTLGDPHPIWIIAIATPASVPAEGGNSGSAPC